MNTQLNTQNFFAGYPDVVGITTMRKMLGGIGKNAAYDLLKKGVIKSKKVGGSYIIAKTHIIEFLFS